MDCEHKDRDHDDVLPVYLDYNATTPLDPLVVERISQSLQEDWGNPSSSHVYGTKATAEIERSRSFMAKMLNANPDDIVFTSGGTEANNMALLSVIRSSKRKSQSERPHVITSSVEHDSIARVLLEQEEMGEIELSFAQMDSTGRLRVESLLSLVKDTTCLVSVMHANNESGIIMPIEEIGTQIRILNTERTLRGLESIIFHSDAAQTVGKIPTDVQALKVDLLTVVGHKFYGPRIGALYARNLLHNSIPIMPILNGGSQERGYRPGTENTPMITGLGKAAELVTENLDAYTKNMREMAELLARDLKDRIPGLKINFSNTDGELLPNTLSVCLPQGFEASSVLNESCKGKLLASLGAACHSNTDKPSPVLLASGLSTSDASRTLRLSVGRTTTKDEIKSAVKILSDACSTSISYV